MSNYLDYSEWYLCGLIPNDEDTEKVNVLGEGAKKKIKKMKHVSIVGWGEKKIHFLFFFFIA